MASARAAGVMRVVLTSSTVALTDPLHRGMMNETTWCDPEAADTSAYAKSKTLAETAAWQFATEQGMQLTTINPGFVMGPPLDANFGSSISVIARLLRGKDPMLPNIGFAVVDVRDVAEAHLRALQNPSSAGKRFPCVAGMMTMPEMGKVLKRAYPNRRIATRVAPTVLLRLLAMFDPQIRAILPDLGQYHAVSNNRARTDLGMRFISSEGALRASADWLITHNAL
jgi:dihydroflavonol-4-reductase